MLKCCTSGKLWRASAAMLLAFLGGYAMAQTYEGFYCVKEAICGGAHAAGKCEPHGVVCSSITCDPESQGYPYEPDGCSWTYEWNCWGPALSCCFVISNNVWSTNCGPDCNIVSFNQCSCDCENYGGDTFESTYLTYCVDGPCPPSP